MLKVKTEFEAKDITSDVFLKYIRYVRSNKTFKDDQHLERWLIAVTKTTVMDYYRSRMHKNENEMEEDIIDVMNNEQHETKNDFVSSLERKLSHEEIMGKLNPRYRDVLAKYYDFGYSVKEIAAQMNESEANVKTLLFRAKKKYKEIAESVGENND